MALLLHNLPFSPSSYPCTDKRIQDAGSRQSVSLARKLSRQRKKEKEEKRAIDRWMDGWLNGDRQLNDGQ